MKILIEKCNIVVSKLDVIFFLLVLGGCKNEGDLLNQLIEGKLISSKIFSIHFLDEKSLLVCGSGGCMKTFTFNETGNFHFFTME